MSLWTSKQLSKEEMDELLRRTVFSVTEIEALFDRFKYLDRSGGDFLTFLDFQLIPEFYSNPFCSLLITYLESLNSFEKVSFASYLEFMSVFSSKTPIARRILFLFNIFDLDKIRKITKKNLEKIYELMTCREDPEAAELVLKLYDKDNKGYLSLEDFGDFYNSNPNLEKNMIIDFTRLIPKKKAANTLSKIWTKKPVVE